MHISLLYLMGSGEAGSILGWEDSLDEENGILQYSCLMDRGAWWVTAHSHKSQTRLSKSKQ